MKNYRVKVADRLEDMDKQELVFHAYAIDTLDEVCIMNYTDEEMMEAAFKASTESLRKWIGEFDDETISEELDNTTITYKGYEIVRETDEFHEYGVHEGVGEDWERYLWFMSLYGAVEYIDYETK